MEPFAQIFVDMKTKRFYVYRPDDPQNPYHEISIYAAMDLSKQLQRYQVDFAREKETKRQR